MFLLIDGYNLLHVTGIFGKGQGPGTFQRSREAFLRFLAASIEPQTRSNTTIVFDAADAPPGLPDTYQQDEMLVRYARDYPDADSLIEELIQQHSSPRRLLVVSSDHRIQRAARRRRARFVDSDVWYTRLWEQRTQTLGKQSLPTPEKPIGQLSAAEIEYWVNEFSSSEHSSEDSEQDNRTPQHPAEDSTLDNPFPPGYAEDLWEE